MNCYEVFIEDKEKDETYFGKAKNIHEAIDKTVAVAKKEGFKNPSIVYVHNRGPKSF